jgi:hypothetical protein
MAGEAPEDLNQVLWRALVEALTLFDRLRGRCSGSRKVRSARAAGTCSRYLNLIR